MLKLKLNHSIACVADIWGINDEAMHNHALCSKHVHLVSSHKKFMDKTTVPD